MQLDALSPVLDGLAASIFLIDADRRIMLINSAGKKLFGSELIGADFVQAIRNPRCLEAINKVLQGKNKSELVITLQKPVRTTCKIMVTRLVSSNDANKSSGPIAVVSLEDISHIIEAEQMRSVFVANVSHELRSPLTTLNGFIETLKGAARDDAKARDHFLGIMEREAFRMNRLIGDLLSLSKVEADAHIRPDEKIDLSELVKQVANVLEPTAKKENVELHLTIAENLQTLILGDPDQLQQVFVNLIENAIKYGGTGGSVTIVFSERTSTIANRHPAIQVDVTDQGAGIKAKHIPHLTERFYRIDKGRSREKGGTGLGLAIVKHILARHRGRLQITSEVGKGSTFTVVLPR